MASWFRWLWCRCWCRTFRFVAPDGCRAFSVVAPARRGRNFHNFRVRHAAGPAAAVLLLATTPASADVSIDLGVQSSRVEADVATLPTVETTETGLHVGIGASRSVGERNEIGVRLELDNLGSDTLLAVRALDYRRHITPRLAVSAFVGAARLDLATPAYGYYFGGGVQLKDLMTDWDLGLDLRFGDKVARDNLLPTDPQGGRPDNFYDITGVSLYLRYGF